MITRPKDWGKDLGEKLQARGYKTDFFPGIEIAPTSRKSELKNAVQNLTSMDMAIFSSRSAVYYGMKTIVEYHDYFNKDQGEFHHSGFDASIFNNSVLNKRLLRFVAIGPGTAEELRQFGIQEIISPRVPPFETESLLALSDFQNIHGLQIMLFRGNGGRASAYREP